jgi:hypothetical protein
MLLFCSLLFCSTWHPLARRTESFRNTNSVNWSGEVIAGMPAPRGVGLALRFELSWTRDQLWNEA